MKVMLAEDYDGHNIDGWLMSEKLDGVRAIWTGEKLVSRNGNEFFAPKWFTDSLPAGVVLDGELFIGRGMFQSTVGVVRRKKPVDSDWQKIQFCVFDAPECVGGFEQRLAYCNRVLTGCKVACVVEHRVCRNAVHLDEVFAELCDSGAEGVMLRQPGSAYEGKRSNRLLKYKPFQTDEAEVIGYESGTGRLTNMVGSLILKWKGIVFCAGSGLTDELRAIPPAIGSIVSFGFCGLTDGSVPRHPTFICERSYE